MWFILNMWFECDVELTRHASEVKCVVPVHFWCAWSRLHMQKKRGLKQKEEPFAVDALKNKRNLALADSFQC